MQDRFKVDDKGARAGTHVIADFWDATHLDDVVTMRNVMIKAAHATGATVLDDNFHSFGEKEGCTGVIVLAESHISVHTWPERGYAAVDVFTCGDCDPHKALPVLKEGLEAQSVTVQEILRGIVY